TSPPSPSFYARRVPPDSIARRPGAIQSLRYGVPGEPRPGATPMPLTRRDFLGQTAVALGAAAVAGTGRAATGARKLTSAADQVTLGRSGVKTTLLGLRAP